MREPSTHRSEPATRVDDTPAAASGFGCPACGGALWEQPKADLMTYECRIGHRFAAETLQHAQLLVIEDALWAALRALEERGALARRLSKRREESDPAAATLYARRAGRAEKQAQVLRDTFLRKPIDDLDEAAAS